MTKKFQRISIRRDDENVFVIMNGVRKGADKTQKQRKKEKADEQDKKVMAKRERGR